jgi:hypothetical protein
MTSNQIARCAALSVIACVLSTVPALAGPPLLVHPYDIGTARSLPWSHPQGRADYDRSRLVEDTIAILTSSDSPLVHMETLRRAIVYARVDRSHASRLISALVDRAVANERSAKPDGLVFLDAAYVVEAMSQVDVLNDMAFARVPGLADLVKVDEGHAWIVKAVALRPDDGGVALAAALITRERHQRESEQHAVKARQIATREPLLARNIDHLVH